MLWKACLPEEYFRYRLLNRGAGEVLLAVLECLACEYSFSDDGFALNL